MQTAATLTVGMAAIIAIGADKLGQLLRAREAVSRQGLQVAASRTVPRLVLQERPRCVEGSQGMVRT